MTISFFDYTLPIVLKHTEVAGYTDDDGDWVEPTIEERPLVGNLNNLTAKALRSYGDDYEAGDRTLTLDTSYATGIILSDIVVITEPTGNVTAWSVMNVGGATNNLQKFTNLSRTQLHLRSYDGEVASQPIVEDEPEGVPDDG